MIDRFECVSGWGQTTEVFSSLRLIPRGIAKAMLIVQSRVMPLRETQSYVMWFGCPCRLGLLQTYKGKAALETTVTNNPNLVTDVNRR